MAIVYFDSSAFLKLLIEQDGSDLAAALWDGCDVAVSSRLAYPEVRAALAAAGRAAVWSSPINVVPNWRGRTSGPRPGPSN